MRTHRTKNNKVSCQQAFAADWMGTDCIVRIKNIKYTRRSHKDERDH